MEQCEIQHSASCKIQDCTLEDRRAIKLKFQFREIFQFQEIVFSDPIQYIFTAYYTSIRICW